MQWQIAEVVGSADECAASVGHVAAVGFCASAAFAGATESSHAARFAAAGGAA